MERSRIATQKKSTISCPISHLRQPLHRVDVFTNRDIERQVERVQFGASLKINHAVSGSQPKHFIFSAGQLCRHKLGLAPGFLQISKLSLDALAAEIVDERELRIRSTVDTVFDRMGVLR